MTQSGSFTQNVIQYNVCFDVIDGEKGENVNLMVWLTKMKPAQDISALTFIFTLGVH